MYKGASILNPNDSLKYTYFRGRWALYHILKALNIGKDDEVALQAYTCLAVPEAILTTGAIPLYIDLEKGHFNMDPYDLERKVTSRTKAIILQHTFGIPAKVDKCLEISQKYQIPIIEDCCHALFSKYKGKEVGSFGIASFYSYEWGKPLVAGIGGSLILNEQNLSMHIQKYYENLKIPPIDIQLKVYFQYLAFEYLYTPRIYWTLKDLFHLASDIGLAKGNFNRMTEIKENNSESNYKMIPWCKKILMQKSRLLKKIRDHNIFVAETYKSLINSKTITHPVEPQNTEIVYARYPIFVEDKKTLLNNARKNSIEIAGWYMTPIHPLSGKELNNVKYTKGSCPNAEFLCNNAVSLPINLNIKEKEVIRICKFLIN